MIYSYEMVVNSHDTDYNGEVRAACLMKYMQEAGMLQLEELGPSPQTLFDAGRTFFLSRAVVSIYRSLRAYEKIRVETWGCESRGVSFVRSARIFRGDDLVCEMVTVWALLDINSGSLVRTADFEAGFKMGQALELYDQVKLRIPEGVKMSLMGEYPVTYAVCDVNRHMNNTCYPDMFCGFLPMTNGQRVVSLTFSFAAEAKMGCTLKIYSGEGSERGRHYFRAVGDDGKTCTEAEIVLEE
ncbi:MAG: thioesterase [Oscillospiraceae bacterium]|nr:thioesterase [Oscillospiraceae bacterium]